MPAFLDALPLHGAGSAESLFLRLFGDAETAFWLDAGADATAGWSILGTGRIETDGDVVRSVPLAEGRGPVPHDPVPHDPVPHDPVPFRGGWIGWMSYEQGAAALGAPVADDDRGEAWIAAERGVAIEHATGRAFALASAGEASAWREEVQRLLTGDRAVPPVPPPAPQRASARHGVDEYLDMVEQCRAAIERGDAYQLCLTTRFTVPPPADPLAVYRRLRGATPAHHGGYIRVGERHLLSASPEQFLSVAHGSVSTSPIKGTRPRDVDALEDARLAEELRTDVKERAENVMIVDLMRNDLSQVGEPGTVRVERLWEVESYPAVHQLVSTVSARLRDGVTLGELVDAAFPAGSMTGAPKLSAMTILRRLERAPRGVYSGCFGHVGLDGRADLAMIIRSVVVEADAAYVGAGGGITWLSRADAEAAEVAIKARAPLSALGATLPAEWAGILQSR